jgi:hypothetical protein
MDLKRHNLDRGQAFFLNVSIHDSICEEIPSAACLMALSWILHWQVNECLSFQRNRRNELVFMIHRL